MRGVSDHWLELQVGVAGVQGYSHEPAQPAAACAASATTRPHSARSTEPEGISPPRIDQGTPGLCARSALPSIRTVHLRRALLLFAIVLGLAAIAASVSRPGDNTSERGTSSPGVSQATDTERAPTASPGSADAAEPLAAVTFDNPEREPTRRVSAGQATTVLVEVDEPGEVEIPDLGLSAPGEPLTPARFEVFSAEPGTHEVLFTPAAADEPDEVGTLAIEPEDG